MEAELTYQEISDVADTHTAALLLFARQWDTSSAEDVVQQAFLKLVEQAKRKKRPDNIPSWLYRVVRNEISKRHRRNKSQRRREEKVATLRGQWFESSDAIRLDSQEAAHQLKTLSTKKRAVVVARIWGELSFQQIAEVMNLSQSSAHRQYVEAIEELRQKLL